MVVNLFLETLFRTFKNMTFKRQKLPKRRAFQHSEVIVKGYFIRNLYFLSFLIKVSLWDVALGKRKLDTSRSSKRMKKFSSRFIVMFKVQISFRLLCIEVHTRMITSTCLFVDFQISFSLKNISFWIFGFQIQSDHIAYDHFLYTYCTVEIRIKSVTIQGDLVQIPILFLLNMSSFENKLFVSSYYKI